MPRVPLALPPGIYRNGTEYQSKGRWYDCSLVRFYANTIQPYGGWVVRSTSAMSGKARAVIAWKDNSGSARAGIGTHSHLYAMARSGTVYDITPAGFTPGRADAASSGGYGSGTYGTGSYGSARPATGTIQDASVWSLDTWGEYLIGVMADDGKIYQWTLDPGVVAAVVTNAPTARAILTTAEGILFALGADGNPRNVAWSDQRDNTVWTPSATNQAGDFDLQTSGRLMLGKKIKGGNLLLTDEDAHFATYTADTLVYSFGNGPVGTGCGAISQNCAAVFDNAVYWLSKSGFWKFDGYPHQIPCDILDYVFSDIDMAQASKTTCEVDSSFGEVTWRYQSLSSATGEVDKYVTLTGDGQWQFGPMARLVGNDATVFQTHIAVSSDGYVYDHETGFEYDGAIPFLEGGPVELGEGDNVYYITGLIPDEKTLGDVSLTLKPKFEPEDVALSYGPYSLASKTDLRLAGRQVNVRFDGVEAVSWRIGVPRLIVEGGGTR